MRNPIQLRSPCIRSVVNASAVSLFALPCRIDEATEVGVEGAIDRVQDSQLSQGLDGKKQHSAGDKEAQQLRIGSAKNYIHSYQRTRHTTEPGPPLLKPGPEPTNRPAPIEPPAEGMRSDTDWGLRSHRVSEHTNSNHLHVATLEVARQHSA